MQFFEHQDQARGRTTLLVCLFFVAVVGLVAASAVTTHFALSFDHPPEEPYTLAHFKMVGTAAILTMAIIFFGSLYRILELRGGGVKVAETLGGTLIHPGTRDLLERRAINVVEEMAIAAGLPVPPVYLMKRETGINAFAAGWSPDDAVIGLTQGALEGLSREQLQGVIAHEFSHILNRDCALNLRLLGVLHGIVVISIVGRILIQMGTGGTRSNSKNQSAFQFAIVGVVVWLFGSVGVVVARFIQAAVSRQREYLADASAVQFTRNPEGIAGALATIGSHSSALSTPRGEESSHMLIGEPGEASFLSGLASHPPLFDRIKRVLPNWQGDFAALATPAGSVRKRLEQAESGGDDPELSEENLHENLLELMTGGVGKELSGLPEGLATLAPEALLGAASQGTTTRSSTLTSDAARLLHSIPAPLRAAAEEPFSARALIFTWLLDADPEARTAQLALLSSDPPLARETERLMTWVPDLSPSAVLPLFDIALGTLAALSPEQKDTFSSLLDNLMAQLSPHSFRSYCLASLAQKHLLHRPGKRPPARVLIKDAIEIMLGVLASQGHDTKSAARAAFTHGAQTLGPRADTLQLPAPDLLYVVKFDEALETLLRLPTTTRAELLQAAEAVAGHDGEVRPAEAELLRAMATRLGVATRPVFATGPGFATSAA